MRIHAAEGLPEDIDGVVSEGVRPGESLEEHEAAGYADRLVQLGRQHAALERQLVLLGPRGQDVRLYDLGRNREKRIIDKIGVGQCCEI